MSKVYRLAVRLDCSDEELFSTIVSRFSEKKRNELISAFNSIRSKCAGYQLCPVREENEDKESNECTQYLYFGYPDNDADGKPVIAFTYVNRADDSDAFCIETGVYYPTSKVLSEKFEWFEYDEAEPFSWIYDSVYYALREAKLLNHSGALRVTTKPVPMRADDFESLIVDYVIGEKPSGEKRSLIPTIIVRPDEDEDAKDMLPDPVKELCVVMVDDDSGIAEEAEEYLANHPDTDYKDELCDLKNPAKKYIFMLGCGVYSIYGCKDQDTLLHTMDYAFQNFRLDGERADRSPDFFYEVFTSLSNLLNANKKSSIDLASENDALMRENRALRKKAKELDFKATSVLSVTGKPTNLNVNESMFVAPKMKENYSGEIRSIILDSLQDYLEKYTLSDSRRADVLAEFLKQNPVSPDLSEKKDAVKASLNGYTNITPQMVNDFKAMGMSLKALGSHARIQWIDDKSHSVTLSSTPSDTKTGTNAAMEVIRRLL